MHNLNRSSIEAISFMQLRPKKSALLFSLATFASFFIASSFVYKFFYNEALARSSKNTRTPVSIVREALVDKKSILKLSKLKKSVNYKNLYNQILLEKNPKQVITFKPEENSDEIKLGLTWNVKLQEKAQYLLDKYEISWGSIVAIEPKTGKIITIASKQNDQNGPLALRSTFPAASVFKIVTASAAVESKGFDEFSVIGYRGGNYTLNKGNYTVNNSSDTRRMLLGEALGKSVNPVFGRLALGVIGTQNLKNYAESFLFNKKIPFDFEVQNSLFLLPENDLSLARTGAGFESSFISPLHAALLASTFANKGVMMRPYLIDSRSDFNGNDIKTTNRILAKAILESTAKQVNEMMEYTTSSGTARRFFKNFRTKTNDVVIGKTGTLSGTNPEGRYHWFVGLVPKEDPKLAFSALVIDKGSSRVNGSGLARAYLDEYYNTAN